jgi:hypothetical protein
LPLFYDTAGKSCGQQGTKLEAMGKKNERVRTELITIGFSSQDTFSLTDQAPKEYQIVALNECGTVH